MTHGMLFCSSLFRGKKCDIGPENTCFGVGIQYKSIGWLGPTPKEYVGVSSIGSYEIKKIDSDFF